MGAAGCDRQLPPPGVCPRPCLPEPWFPVLLCMRAEPEEAGVYTLSFRGEPDSGMGGEGLDFSVVMK